MADGQIVVRNPVRLADYAPPAFLIDHVTLEFALDPEATIVRAKLNLRRQTPGALVLNGEQLELRSITLDSAPLGED
ncbi:MAG: hypothetical protein B7Z80_12655, partial [Rhodospirillales bacterium 20-64-7]